MCVCVYVCVYVSVYVCVYVCVYIKESRIIYLNVKILDT